MAAENGCRPIRGNTIGHKKTVGAVKSYIYHVGHEFSRNIDYFHLRGQDNILRYLAVRTMVVRRHQDDSLFDALARIAATRIAGCKLIISIPEDLDSRVTQFLSGKDGRRLIGRGRLKYESDKTLIGHRYRKLTVFAMLLLSGYQQPYLRQPQHADFTLRAQR
jgi:hypothetical protein